LEKHGAKRDELTGGVDNRSSARWFGGFVGRKAETAKRPVSLPKTWLLREGWKRRGLIHWYEGPSMSKP
jgi:hypothetical protein